MLNDETKRKLRLMNIGEFISAVDLQEDDPQLLALPFSERFQMAVDHVYQDKYNMKSERLIKQAKLRFPAADIHDIYYGEKRRLNRNLMGEIATGSVKNFSHFKKMQMARQSVKVFVLT